MTENNNINFGNTIGEIKMDICKNIEKLKIYNEEQMILAHYTFILYEKNKFKFTKDCNKEDMIVVSYLKEKICLYPEGDLVNPENWEDGTYVVLYNGSIYLNNITDIESTKSIFILAHRINQTIEQNILEEQYRQKESEIEELQNILSSYLDEILPNDIKLSAIQIYNKNILVDKIFNDVTITSFTYRNLSPIGRGTFICTVESIEDLSEFCEQVTKQKLSNRRCKKLSRYMYSLNTLKQNLLDNE